MFELGLSASLSSLLPPDTLLWWYGGKGRENERETEGGETGEDTSKRPVAKSTCYFPFYFTVEIRTVHACTS